MHKLESLQYLRAIAAAMVVFVHAVSTYDSKIVTTDFIETSGLAFLGGLGVKIFFVISGFIIYKTTLNKPNNLHSSTDFMIKRLIRIVPIYWIATLIYSTKLTLQGNTQTFSDLLLSLLFIPYTNDIGLIRPILGLGWTLNYEMFFYFTLAIAIIIPVKLRLLSVFTFLLTFLYLFSENSGISTENANQIGIDLLASTYLLFFLAGMALAYINNAFNIKLFRLTSNQNLILLPIIIFFYVYLTINTQLFHTYKLAIELIFSTFIIYLSIITIQKNATEHHVQTKIKNLIVLAGDASYSTYLFHGFIMGPSARIIKFLDVSISPMFFAILMIILCTVGGVIIYKTVETPVINVINKKWRNYKTTH